MHRIILTKNGKYKKTLHRCKTRETSFVNYHKIKDENESIFFPRKFINYNGIKKVVYKILIVKDFEESDEPRVVRDRLGRLIVEEPIFGIWTVLDDSDYDVEENFWLFGKSPIHDRVTVQDILKLLIKGVNDKKLTKQVIVVHNKLVLYNENQFEMIICKNKEDAQRLHHSLYSAFKGNKIKNVIFMGTATPSTVSRMYEIIQNHTGWKMEKIRRTSTRP